MSNNEQENMDQKYNCCEHFVHAMYCLEILSVINLVRKVNDILIQFIKRLNLNRPRN